jgi:predicted permease
MSHTLQVFQTVLAFATVVLLCVLLKKLAIIKAEHGPLFARLLTQVALPVVIFTQLATHPIAGRQLLLVLAMIVAGTICLAVAWVAGRIMKLERPKIGALMLVSAFGSSALIGYPLIQYAFPNNPQAMHDAILVSELGVGLPIFTLCFWVAMYFGKEFGDASKDRRGALLGYFRSPIFIALAAGLLISPLGLNPQQPMLAPFFQASHMVSESITLLSCLILGLQLDLRSVRGIVPLVIISAGIQMFLQPWLADVQATLYRLSLEQRQVLVLESAMPSAILNSVFATRYHCAPQLTSALIFLNILLSLISIPLVFAVLCG